MTDIRDIETDFTDLTDFESESEYTTQTDTLTDTHIYVYEWRTP